MKKIIFSFFVLMMGIAFSSSAETLAQKEVISSPKILSYNYEYVAVVDSGILSTLQKGYEIASKMTLDDVGKMATIVLFNKNKKLDGIVKDVSDYMDQISKTNKDLQKIKINKNTKVYIKRDK